MNSRIHKLEIDKLAEYELVNFVHSLPLVHHLFNKKGSLVGTKSLVHFFKGGGL